MPHSNCSRKRKFLLLSAILIQTAAEAQQVMPSITVYGGGGGYAYGGLTYYSGMSYAVETMMLHVAASKNWERVRNTSCSGGVYREITSLDDQEMRQLAAETAFNAASSGQPLVQRFFGGAMAIGKSFEVTYADGGTESWLITTVVGSLKLSLPHNYRPGDGTPAACPTKG